MPLEGELERKEGLGVCVPMRDARRVLREPAEHSAAPRYMLKRNIETNVRHRGRSQRAYTHAGHTKTHALRHKTWRVFRFATTDCCAPATRRAFIVCLMANSPLERALLRAAWALWALWGMRKAESPLRSRIQSASIVQSAVRDKDASDERSMKETARCASELKGAFARMRAFCKRWRKRARLRFEGPQETASKAGSSSTLIRDHSYHSHPT